MNTYFFDFGRDPRLSYQELITVLDSKKTKYEIISYDRKTALVKTNTNPRTLINELGGTRKIGIILGKKKDVNKIKLYNDTANKFNYSISTYNSSVGQVRNHLKQKWKKQGLKTKYVPLKTVAGPKEIKNKKLLDIILVKDLVGKTISVSDTKRFEELDEKRPVKDSMITTSTRMSRILVNLSGARKGELLLDPFCGLGTILQEAGLKGIRIIGSDADKKMISGCRKNLEYWGLKPELFVCEAENISRCVRGVDYAVTEPYLGPFVKDISYEDARRNVQVLYYLYDKVLEELKKIVRKRIVIILPYYHTRKSKVEMETDKLFKNHGLVKIHEFKLKEWYHNIGRKIFVLET